MRIAVIGPISPDSFSKCIIYSLRDMGHETLSLNLEASCLYRSLKKVKSLEMQLFKAVPGLEKSFWRRPIAEVKRFEPELILSTLWDIPAAILEDLKKAPEREPVAVVWCPDALTNFERQYVFVAPWDFCFFKDQFIVDFCRKKLGLKAHLLPLACYPRWHRPVSLSPAEQEIYGCEIATAAGLYHYRTKFLEPFVHYRMKIWGWPASRYIQSPVLQFARNRYVGELEKAKAFNGAAIVLNNMHYAEILGLNQRVFDACGCGAFQIVDASPVMADYFAPGKELVCFQDLQELKELIPYYLNHPQERAEIARAGCLRAHAEHTFRHRLERMLQIIQGND